MDNIINDRSKVHAKRAENRKKIEIADQKYENWKTTLKPTKTVEEHEEYVSGGLGFIGYKTGPVLQDLLQYDYSNCSVYQQSYDNGGVVVYRSTT